MATRISRGISFKMFSDQKKRICGLKISVINKYINIRDIRLESYIMKLNMFIAFFTSFFICWNKLFVQLNN